MAQFIACINNFVTNLCKRTSSLQLTSRLGDSDQIYDKLVLAYSVIREIKIRRNIQI
jgi:hypothetical protein